MGRPQVVAEAHATAQSLKSFVYRSVITLLGWVTLYAELFGVILLLVRPFPRFSPTPALVPLALARAQNRAIRGDIFEKPQDTTPYLTASPALSHKPEPIPQNDKWAGYPLLKRISSCESWGDPNKEPRQFLPDGQVLQGRTTPTDIGASQISLKFWGNKAIELGFDIYTEQGNFEMAKWIFDRYGSQPWYLSAGCWKS